VVAVVERPGPPGRHRLSGDARRPEGAAGPPRGDVRPRGRPGPRTDAGRVEPVDPRAGHVPGARSAPTTENVGPDGRFRDAGALAARFSALGVPVDGGDVPVGVYCGSGVTAAHEIAALASIGVEAVLYPGSWSQWSSDPGRPVATG